MTMDPSLRGKSGLTRARSVLSRAERIERMKAEEKWQDGRSPLGLPKVRVIKLAMKKKKKAKEEGEAGAEGAAAPAAAAAKGAAAKPAAAKPAAAKAPAKK